MNPKTPMQQQEPEKVQPVDSGEEDLLAAGARINLKHRLKNLGIGGGALAIVAVGIGIFIVVKIFLPTPLITDQTAFEQTGDKTQREDTWVLDIPRNDVLIRMNNGVYIPDNLTVDVGMTIAFTNEDTEQEYWPISSTHPQLFDVSSAMPSGSFWSFTADQTTTYEFSDQLHPGVAGSIRASAPQE